MIKKHATARNKAVLVLLQQIFAISMCAILITLLVNICIKTNNKDIEFVYVDLMEQEKKFQDSSTFRNLFLTDIDGLAYYLAICQQFESDGNFDKNKTIDLLSYVYRKSDDMIGVNSQGKLQYRVGDLINWSEVDGIEMSTHITETDEGEENFDYIYEKYLPIDKISIYDKDLYSILSSAGIMEQLDLIEDDYFFYDEDGEMNYSVDGDYEQATDELMNERAISYISNFIGEAATDLSKNYNTYSERKDYYEKNDALKYIYIPNDDKNIYTNIKEQNINKIINIFENNLYNDTSGTYIKYDFNEDEIETHNFDTNDENHTNIRQMIHSYKYAFSEKGVLYVGYINDLETKTALGEVDGNSGNVYLNAEKAYHSIKPHIVSYIVALFVLFMLYMITFIIWTSMIGWRRELIHSDEGNGDDVKCIKITRDSLKGFDKWYTGIAGLFAFVVEGIIFGCLVILIFDGYMDGRIEILTSNRLIVLSCVLTAFFVGGFQFFWCSLVKRCMVHTFWSNSLIYNIFKLLKWCYRYIVENIIYKTMKSFASGTVLVRFWIPYFIFLLINLFILFITFEMDIPGLGILTGVVVDFIVGIFIAKCAKEKDIIKTSIDRIANGEFSYKLDTTKLHGENILFAESVNRIGDGIQEAVEISMKDEKLKADLITNVSHDIKTPLTSIINYVDLLKRIDIEDDKAKEYLKVLDEKSQRLKQLTLDLVEASKISSGNIVLHFEDIKVKDLMLQVLGEFSDRFEEKNLTVVANFSDEGSVIKADSRRMWRVMENLCNNIYKYALEGTRVYVDVVRLDKLWITIKNISAQELNINADELTERFIRGDVSRSTEGSGLGLSIAKNLVEAQNGTFQIILDGDLFKVLIIFETVD